MSICPPPETRQAAPSPEFADARDYVAALSSKERMLLFQQFVGANTLRRLGVFPIPGEFVLSVVIPVYNERSTIEELIERVHHSGVNCEIIVVDDCSTDGTRDVLASLEDEFNLKIVLHDRNGGKGAAIRTGFLHVTGDAVIIQDADLEYDPAEYSFLLQPIVEGHADAVFGSRFSGDNQRVLYFWHYLANRFLTTLSNCFTNLNLTDMETCYKAFRTEVIQAVGPLLRERGFGIEPELTAKVASLPGIRVFERPISYHGRTYAEGKKITWRDGLRALWCIVRYARGVGRGGCDWRRVGDTLQAGGDHS